MFRLEEPTMVLNAVDAVSKYSMTNSMDVPANDTPEHFLGWAAVVAGGMPGNMLKSLVINCHGYYNGSTRDSTGGYGLKMGTGIFRADTSKFGVLKGKVAGIYITSCGAARISQVDATGNGDGNLFCCEIAKASGAYVYAGTTQQISNGLPIYPRHYIADYDGLVLRYTPSGGVDWTQDYGRGLIDGLRWGWN
jgi:hypothetical protein